MAKVSDLTVERVREALDYDPDTGLFRWRVPINNRVHVGDVAGCLFGRLRKRRLIGIDGEDLLAHRLAWFHFYGVWPTLDLDHINEIPSDNRIANLRESTVSENKQNVRNPSKANTSGFVGVTRHEGRWQAQIKINGKQYHLGRFRTPEEASIAYQEAKLRLHPFAARPVDNPGEEMER